VAVAPIWLAAALLPVLHLIPMGSIFASRHLWPALLPLAWLAAWGLETIAQRWPRSQRPVAVLAGGWLMWCAAITTIHLGEHRSGTDLWRAVAMRHPGNAVAHQNLGQHLLIDASRADEPEPLWDEARRHLETALSIDTAFADAWASLGRLELDMHRWDAAEAALERATALDANHVPALFDLGVLATTRGDWDGARALWERVVALEPLYPNAQAFLARLPGTV
jgi:tetratricopeptide (TPR) repeat protein